MIYKFSALAAVLALSACASAGNETRTAAVLEDGFNAGERYEIRNRLLEGPDGTFTQTSVVYKGLSRPCILDSPNDCESAARQLIEEYDDFIF